MVTIRGMGHRVAGAPDGVGNTDIIHLCGITLPKLPIATIDKPRVSEYRNYVCK
jgi:hypothetical protein